MSHDVACAGVVTALEGDPFYRAICAPHADDVERRCAILMRYFDYSIEEGKSVGRTVYAPDATQGVAVWNLPQSENARVIAAARKREFLADCLSVDGFAAYYNMVEDMHRRAADLVPSDAWYLSIVAVAPEAQGRGLGRQVLAPTLREADAAGVSCFLETFNPRSIPFYERLGFVVEGEFVEGTARARYAMMSRPPCIQPAL